MSLAGPRTKRFAVIGFLAVAVSALPLVVGLLGFGFATGNIPSSVRNAAGLGNVTTLAHRYAQWQAAYTEGGGAQTLVVPLGPMRMGRVAPGSGHGRAMLDLTTGRLRVELLGLAPQDALELWLVHRDRPEERAFHVGALVYEAGRHVLDQRLALASLRGFEIDRIVVAHRGAPPAAPLLSGSPTLFQRLYHRAGVRAGNGIQYAQERLGGGSAPASSGSFAFLVPAPAYADSSSPEALLAALIDRGEDLFFNETFDGNGRTCGTCHRAERNFAIDAAFIATLPPTDPLFVAEQNPALTENFEKPELMRQRGLILENVDGTDDLAHKFVVRGVPHTLSMLTSMSSTTPFDEPFNRTGWSGDGAPGSGTLREFALGAVRQHFTKTLSRDAGVDFRVPTEEELNAMEAFQFSLGRDKDLDLTQLKLKSSVARAGLDLFRGAGKCNTCHLNAGATPSFAPGINFNFNTGVEALSVAGVPKDGGLGTGFNATIGAFGDGTFNTPPLVEAADTGPFFHNNAVNTIEEAVAFYTTDAFKNSPSGPLTGGIVLNQSEINAIGAFLRVINADFNIDQAQLLGKRALGTTEFSKASRLLTLASSETQDAINVLSGARLHVNAVTRLRIAKALLDSAATIPVRAVRNGLVTSALAQETVAKGLLIED
jgi:cytochrome c peroxidase